VSSLTVLETNILHASDVIWWLDGSSGESTATMLRLGVPLQLQLSSAPRDLQLVHGRGKTALLRRPTLPLVSGSASVADTLRPPAPAFALEGVVSDPDGRFIPRRFSISAGAAAGHALVLFPTPLGTRFGPAGGVLGCLRFAGSGLPVPWALLTLTVTTALGAVMVFRGQASARGDFMIPMHRLPPLPEGIASHAATLAVAARVDAAAATPLDPATLLPMALGDLVSAATFSNPIGLNVVPGEIRLIRSSSLDHLAVQPS
jgi:hypothetical protein